MIGLLPKSLEIGENQYSIRSDFRVALLIFEAFNDAELSDSEKTEVCLKCLYKEIPADTETKSCMVSGRRKCPEISEKS